MPEQLDLKVRLLKEVDACCKPGAILASNTSSISITELAAKTSRPERFIGMHFMNPVPVMQLVEVIRGARNQRRDVRDHDVALREAREETRWP